MVHAGNGKPYKRYADTESGISPMAVPGVKGAQYVGESLTHGERGSPSTSEANHIAQIAKRARKLDQFDFGDRWADIEGDGEVAIITWGSCSAPVREAIGRRGKNETPIRLVSLRLIAPAQPKKMIAALEGVKRVLIVEQSHSGQLEHYLRAHFELTAEIAGYRRAGPLPFLPNEIRDRITEWLS